MIFDMICMKHKNQGENKKKGKVFSTADRFHGLNECDLHLTLHFLEPSAAIWQ